MGQPSRNRVTIRIIKDGAKHHTKMGIIKDGKIIIIKDCKIIIIKDGKIIIIKDSSEGTIQKLE